MKKKILFAITCMFFLTVLLWMCGTTVKAGKETEPVVAEPTAGYDNGFGWRLHEGEIIITNYTGDLSDVVIPAFIRGYPVTQIGTGVFKTELYSKNKIDSVTIPESVTIIGHSAFYNNNLVGITLPPSLKHIGNGAFGLNQLNEITIPEGVTIIGDNAFSRNKLVGVTLPSSLTHIGNEAFRTNKLNEITLPPNVTSIGNSAFLYNNLSSVTIPAAVAEIGMGAFADNPLDNPLNEIIIKSDNLRSLPHYVFHPDIPGFLPPGVYKKQNEQWFFQDSDGTLLSLLSYYEKLVRENPGHLQEMLYDAVNRLDTTWLKNCISLGADVNSRMLNGQGNTPLAAIFNDRTWQIRKSVDYFEYPLPNVQYREKPAEMAAVLLEAGAVPQRWMLYYSYYRPDIVKTLLERGALTNTESPEYGDPPAQYLRPESLLFHYCINLGKQYNTDYGLNSAIAESSALLLEYGEDPNYRDPSGQTPLDLAMANDAMEMAGLLYKHKPRPLPHEEYILLVGLNRERVLKMVRVEWGKRDEDRLDICGFDAMVLEDIRRGFLNPELKDRHGKDIFDYAVETGTAKLMEGLIPYLLRSNRTIIARDRTGLYFDALNAKNLPVAAVLSLAMNNKFTERDSRGNEYSLEYYTFDYDTIYDSSQKIPHHSLYQLGPGGTRRIGGEQTEVFFSENKFYITSANRWGGSDLSLHTVDGRNINLVAVINEQREQYYRENGREKPNVSDPVWRIVSTFGDIFQVHTPWNNLEHYSVEHALIDISGNKPTIYILENSVLVETGYFTDVINFIINAGKAYLIRKSGDVMICTVERNTLRYENTVPWKECRIPGWRGGEHYFVEDEIVTAYNFSTGRARPLGKKIEIPSSYYYSGYIYEDANGRRFIAGEGGDSHPLPDEEVARIKTFDQGYIYNVKDGNFRVICFFENGVLKRKIVLSGDAAVWGDLPSLHGNKLYLGMPCLALTIDLTSMRIIRAFNTDNTGNNSGIEVYMFPFGTDDVVYTLFLFVYH